MTALPFARSAGAGDDVDGVRPSVVCEPPTVEALAGTLAAASAARQALVVRGGGTKLGWGRPPRDLVAVLSTAALPSTIVHRDGDLTATVGAGVTLAQLNAHLAARRQWLPVESAFERATIGGVVATNDAGPLRHRHGTPRDLLIGVTLALGDGRVVKAGGTVVKNVAGYDLGRFVSGSFGSFAVVVDATFKLLPMPGTSRTLVCRYTDRGALAADVAALAASQVEPLACDVCGTEDGLALLVRVASSPAATDAQAEAATALLSGEITAVSGDAEAGRWRAQVREPWQASDLVVRASWLSSQLDAVLAALEDLAGRVAAVRVHARAIGGTGLVSVSGTVDQQIAAVRVLREAHDVLGHVVVLRAPASVKQAVDVWGEPGPAAAVLAALKRSFDPPGVLNAGRGPV